MPHQMQEYESDQMRILAEEQFERIRKKRTLKERGKGFDKIIRLKNGSYKIRCQGKLKNGKQCGQIALRDKFFCNFHHHVLSGAVSPKTKAIRETLGIYGTEKQAFLHEELKQVQKLSQDELLDMTKEVEAMTAVVNKLMKQEPVARKNAKGIIIETVEQNGLKLAKNLQYALMNLNTLKSKYFEAKYSDANTVSKDLYVYTCNRFVQIIKDRIKDMEVLKLISEDIRRLNNDILSGKL